MNVVLVFFRPDGQRRDLPVNRPSTVLGRGGECTMRIPVSQVSRRHCELIQNNGSIKLKDLGSSNGTYVNGKRVVEEKKLKAGDRVQLGPIMFTIQIDGKPSQIEPSIAPAGSEPASAHDTTRTISPQDVVNAPPALTPLEELEPATELTPADELAPADELEPVEALKPAPLAPAEEPTPAEPLVLEESPLEEISDSDVFAGSGTAEAAGSDDSFAALLQEFSSPDDLESPTKK